jgi:hypothetical protein
LAQNHQNNGINDKQQTEPPNPCISALRWPHYRPLFRLRQRTVGGKNRARWSDFDIRPTPAQLPTCSCSWPQTATATVTAGSTSTLHWCLVASLPTRPGTADTLRRKSEPGTMFFVKLRPQAMGCYVDASTSSALRDTSRRYVCLPPSLLPVILPPSASNARKAGLTNLHPVSATQSSIPSSPRSITGASRTAISTRTAGRALTCRRHGGTCSYPNSSRHAPH